MSVQSWLVVASSRSSRPRVPGKGCRSRRRPGWGAPAPAGEKGPNARLHLLKLRTPGNLHRRAPAARGCMSPGPFHRDSETLKTGREEPLIYPLPFCVLQGLSLRPGTPPSPTVLRPAASAPERHENPCRPRPRAGPLIPLSPVTPANDLVARAANACGRSRVTTPKPPGRPGGAHLEQICVGGTEKNLGIK